MFVADQLIYLELQKTGGSHIRRLLKQYTTGHTVGKHNRLHTLPKDKSVIGSIRNPWDWYVSLWAYGVSGQGAIRARSGKRLDFDYYYRMLPKAMGKNWLTPGQWLTCVSHDLAKPVNQWQQSYVDSTDADLFRSWLRLLLDRNRRFDIGEGYGFSPLSNHAGLLTYRYFRLYTLGDQVFQDKRLSVYDGIAEYDEEYNISNGVVRMEFLEEDFVLRLQEAGVQFSEKQLASILNKETGKTNTSKRKPMSYYYDAETIALVMQADHYLIDKYGYQPPI